MVTRKLAITVAIVSIPAALSLILAVDLLLTEGLSPQFLWNLITVLVCLVIVLFVWAGGRLNK